MINMLNKLPPRYKDEFVDIETKSIMKAAIKAERKLAELKGYAEVVPNKNILINAITINEAKDSSEIENIITTHDELFKALSDTKRIENSAKEVINYKRALWRGFELINEKGMITTNIIVEIQKIIEENNAGIRSQSGTVLKNNKTGKVIYTPPAEESQIRDLLKNLEAYINKEDNMEVLVKMAVIHYQFESIHPFFDGNGRTGRILNVLYLVLKNLLDSPILYLSNYINNNKQEYYQLIQNIHDSGDWESWILYILKGIEEMSESSLRTLKRIDKLFQDIDNEIKSNEPTIYSRELTELIFKNFYTLIKDVQKTLNVTRKTSSNYLYKLVELGILKVEKRGRQKIFINHKLIDIVKG